MLTAAPGSSALKVPGFPGSRDESGGQSWNLPVTPAAR
jgi:hypothetical protein